MPAKPPTAHVLKQKSNRPGCFGFVTFTFFSRSPMRFKLIHLFFVVLAAAMVLVAIDRCSRSTMVGTISDAKVTLDANQTPIGYTLTFSIRGDQHLIVGSAADTFGYNRLLGVTVTQSNLSRLNGREIQISYRKQKFLWLPATGVQDMLSLNFRYLIIWQNDSW